VGGSQNAGGTGKQRGTFGAGGDATGESNGLNIGAGGGGWFGGGSGIGGGPGGGGGSGYVLTADSYKPSGYKLGPEYYLSNAQTIAGNQTFKSPTGTNETGHSGNGYARITLVE